MPSSSLRIIILPSSQVITTIFAESFGKLALRLNSLANALIIFLDRFSCSSVSDLWSEAKK